MKQLQNTIRLLRFPFSIFLLPISLFSFFYIHPALNYQLLLVLIVWHVLVFPSSNGYNSYHDQDEGPIGGLASPPKPTEMLRYVTGVMDAVAVLLSVFVNIYFAAFVAFFIIISRLYSNRKVRLKKYPVLAFLVVITCQGAGVFCANVVGLRSMALFSNTSVVFAAIASSFFIGTIYPLTQIYQHDADRQDGVETLSMLLGKKGTFVFSGLMFSLAVGFIYLSFRQDNTVNNFWLFNIIMLPATLYFIVWAIRSFRDTEHVNFKNTMTMLVLSSFLNNVFFLTLLLK